MPLRASSSRGLCRPVRGPIASNARYARICVNGACGGMRVGRCGWRAHVASGNWMQVAAPNSLPIPGLSASVPMAQCGYAHLPTSEPTRTDSAVQRNSTYASQHAADGAHETESGRWRHPDETASQVRAARGNQHRGHQPVSTESRERATVDEGSGFADLRRRQLPRWMRIRAQALRLPNDDLARLGEAITLEQRRRRRGGPVPVEPPVGAPIATADPPTSDGVVGRSDEQGGSGACPWPRPLPRPRLAEDIAQLHRPSPSDPSSGQRRSSSGAQAEKAHSPRRTSATSEDHRSHQHSPAPSPTFSPPQQPHRATAMPSLDMPTLRLLPVINLRLGRLSDGVDDGVNGEVGAHPGARRRASVTRPCPATAPRPAAARPPAP